MISDDEQSFEEILDKHASLEATDDDKIYILAMVNRLRRILHWEPDEDEDLFQRENGTAVIRDIIRHFIRWKAYIGNSQDPSNAVGVQHLVIFSLAKLSFYYWIKDSNTVAEILSHVYSCDGHFSSIFAHIVNRHDGRTLWPSRIPDNKEREHLTMLYFLSHAHNAKLEFDGVRFVDMRLRTPLQVPPALLAALYNKPRLLLLILRYGANINGTSSRVPPDDWDLHMLLRHLTRTLWASLGSEFQNPAWNSTIISNTLNDVWQCLMILLRVIRQIEMGQLNFALMNFNQGGITVNRSSHEFVRWISDVGIVSKYASRYLEPSELKHLSRYAIRKALNDNWNLPYGIFNLPLPKSLQSYINLSVD